MRIAFVRTLTDIIAHNPHAVLLTGDLGFSIYEDLQARYPAQYINGGVAEQNLTGVAAGMALEGKMPFIYSIVPFITMRNYEQIRNDICYQQLNVKIVGVGAGFSYGIYGHTHYGLEDIALMKTLPNMTIFSPGDAVEVAWATREAARIKGPCYIRLGKAGEPVVHDERAKFVMGKGFVLQKGKDITILATGVLVPRALEVAAKLNKQGISATVASIHTVVPLDSALILDCAKKTKAIFTLEEHFIQGGLGSSVAEVLAQASSGVVFERFGVNVHYFHKTGSQEFMRSLTGLTVSQITSAIRAALKKRKLSF